MSEEQSLASDHTGDPSEFYDVISMLTGTDVQSATALRAIFERLHDNTAFLRERSDGAFLKQAAAPRKKTTVFSNTSAFMAGVTPASTEDTPLPPLAIKPGQEAQMVFDGDDTDDFAGGTIPSLTSVRDAAVNPSGRIVVVGGGSPFNVFKVPGGSWTGGGSEPGGTVFQVIYDPGYGGFMCYTASSFLRSTDATSWAASTGFTDSFGIAAVGAGAGNGRIVVLRTANPPVFDVSTDQGATFSASGGTVPHAASADAAGNLSGCPLVTKLDLNEYVYHCSTYDSLARIRLARSKDGVNWEDGPAIEAPSGCTIALTKFMVCKTSGLMVVIATVTQTADSLTYFAVYTSLGFREFSGPMLLKDSATNAFAVAGGRLLVNDGADLSASDGVSHEVFST